MAVFCEVRKSTHHKKWLEFPYQQGKSCTVVMCLLHFSSGELASHCSQGKTSGIMAVSPGECSKQAISAQRPATEYRQLHEMLHFVSNLLLNYQFPGTRWSSSWDRRGREVLATINRQRDPSTLRSHGTGDLPGVYWSSNSLWMPWKGHLLN